MAVPRTGDVGPAGATRQTPGGEGG
jgi:hypothetical protein